MKLNKSIVWSLVLLIVVGSIYRVIPNRPWGFTPQLAMALFAGAMIKDKKWAFALPLFSMFLSDLLYQALYLNGLSEIPGFYKGQWTNYLLFAGVTCVGFAMKKVTAAGIFLYSLLAPTLYFLVSNFLVWANGGGLHRPKTWTGLLMGYTDALPFYRGTLLGTIVFSMILFGGYFLLNRPQTQAENRLA
jgi:hypothetical protein